LKKSGGLKREWENLWAGNRSYRYNLQALCVKPEFLSALGAVASVTLDDLAGGLKLKSGVEEFAALAA